MKTKLLALALLLLLTPVCWGEETKLWEHKTGTSQDYATSDNPWPVATLEDIEERGYRPGARPGMPLEEERYAVERVENSIGDHGHFTVKCGVCNNYLRIKELEARIEKLEIKKLEEKINEKISTDNSEHYFDSITLELN